MANEYLQRRDEIARRNNLIEIGKVPDHGWSTGKVLSTNFDDDKDGFKLLELFSKEAGHYRGGCYADGDESIVLWDKSPSEVRASFRRIAEELRASIGSRALFHPGHLPIGRHKEWPMLRIENLNPDQYNSGLQWLWTINIKPGLDTRALNLYEFFMVQRLAHGASVGVSAVVRMIRSPLSVIRPNDNMYIPECPYVTTQARLDRLIIDVNHFVEKLRAIHLKYDEALFSPESNESNGLRQPTSIWPV